MPILLCHMSWMTNYNGENSIVAGGFGYVRDRGYGHEVFNFKKLDGYYYGFVQTHGNRINVERLGGKKDSEYVDNITVVWTAQNPEGKRVVVGYYRNARVYRSHQIANKRVRKFKGELVSYIVKARATDCSLIPAEHRILEVPYGESDLPGQSSLFYADQSRHRKMRKFLVSVEEYMSSWSQTKASEAESSTQNNRSGRGWATKPDAAHNAAVEAAAIGLVRHRYGNPSRDRQRDNCGWDLEFRVRNETHCVEVKGTSLDVIAVELTPNEFSAMSRSMKGTFSEGKYRLAVVTRAISEKPQLYIFAYNRSKGNWRCENTRRVIEAVERKAATLRDIKSRRKGA